MKKIFTFLAVALFATTMWATQTVLAPGSKQLATAISNATAGDTIVFQTGIYTENGDGITQSKQITLMAEEGAKPILKIYAFRITTDFEINGITIENISTDNYLLRTGGNVAGTIAIKNCTLSNQPSTPFLYLSSNSVTTLEIDNCVFTGTTKNKGGLIYACDAGNIITNFTMTNSTAYNIAGELAIYMTGCTNALVDHCTFYNCGTRPVYIAGTLTTCVVKNCIVSAPESASAYCIATYGGTVSNCLYYNYNAPRSGSGSSVVTVTDCTKADPLFKDAANADFTLKGGSPALTAGVGGTAAGDPRWVPTTRDPKIEVAPGTKTINAALATAQEGDTLILSTGEYNETSSDTIYKKITIMAAAGAKPIMKINKIVIKEELEVNGIEITNLGDDYMLRTGDNVDGTITIKNCYMHSSKTSFLYLSGNTVTNVVIDNCVFADNTKTQGAVVYASNDGCAVTNFTMTNSTAYNCGTELTCWFQGLANASVDHCTFYNCGSRVLYFKGSSANPLLTSVINNTVVSNPTEVSGEVVTPYTGSVSNMVYFNTTNGVNWQATTANVVKADPKFVDAANGNFNFSITSPLLLGATDGKHIGDPRWTAELGAGIDLPDVLNKANVSTTHKDMTYYETDYFDFGPNDSSNDTLLWAMWAVNVAKGKFSVVAELTSTNDYKLQLEFIDPTTSEVVMTVLGKTKNPDFGKVDLNGLVAGKYLLRLKNRTGWSAVKVKSLTFEQVGGKAVTIPATLLPTEENLMLSQYAEVNNDSIFFAREDKSWFVADGWAKWNITVTEKGNYKLTANTCVNAGYGDSNGWQYKLDIINGTDTIYTQTTAKKWFTGDTALNMGAVVLEPGTYTLQMKNIMNYSHGRLLSVAVEKQLTAYPRTIEAGRWGTICYPYLIQSVEGAELYEPVSKTETELTVDPVSMTDVVAGKAYFFIANEADPVFYYNAELDPASDTIQNNGLIGTFTGLTLSEQKWVLTNNTIKKAIAGSTVDANRAYLDLMQVSSTPAPARAGRKVFNIANTPNTPTELMNVNANINANGKMMINGKLIIIRDGKMFNAQGAQL